MADLRFGIENGFISFFLFILFILF